MSKKRRFEEIIASQGRLIYTHQGDSMFPLIRPRDLLVIEAVGRPLLRGDVPLYRRESGQYVLHRIVGVTDSGFVTCGDNRTQCEYGVSDKQIIGVLTEIIRDGQHLPVASLPDNGFIQAGEDLIYLLSCAVNERTPEEERCKAMRLETVYRLSRFHQITSAAAFALERAVPLPHAFDQAKKKAIRKLALFEIERADILRSLDEAGIWYLPLKGVVLGALYPKSAMREMSDNDILCDPERMGDVRALMEQKGYVCEHYGEYHHDIYSKPPTLEFEMHHALIGEEDDPRLAAYFAGVKERLVPVSGCRYRFCDEDFYIYLLCHIYKHYSHAGTGLRSLLDIYVYLRAVPGLDRDYLVAELKKLDLTGFEEKLRVLSEKVFTLQPLNGQEHRELMRFVWSGLYGTREQLEYRHYERALGGDDSAGAKRRYLLRRVFISGESLQRNYPFVARHKTLYPFLLVVRPFKGLITRPKGIIKEIKTVKYFKKKD